VRRPSITRRQVLQAGALAALAGAVRPAPSALAARPASLFELDLDLPEVRAAAAGAGGWRTTKVIRAPRRFDLIGLRWARGSHAEAQVRARRRGGRWTGWAPLASSADHGPDDGRAVPGTDPAFVGAADEFQLRLRGTPGKLRARFVRALPTATAAQRLSRRLRRRRAARAAKAPQAGAPPDMVMREEWGADAVPPREPPLYGAVQMALVHHTVTANDYDPEDSAGIVLGIARYHRNSNGWNDIGYNFLVDKYGQIFEGRAGGIDQPVVGAQAQGWNSNSTGIAYLGDFTSATPDAAGMDALARVIGWKLTVHAVPTEGQVVITSAGGSENKYPSGAKVTFERIGGHRDGCKTSCPGNGLYAQLAALRVAAGKYAGPATGLTVGTLREIRGIKPVEVSGFLRFEDGSPSNGVPVALEFQAVDAYWEPLTTAVCAADGSWTTTVTFPESGKVRAIFAGDAGRARLESAPRKVTVLARLSVKLGRRRLRLGKSVSIRGTAEPADTVRILVQRRVRRRWVRERTRELRVRGGAFHMRLRPRGRGRYRLTIQVGRVKRRRYLRVL
jgi:N-acetylmuramoyl-L-alanine amidase-like protein